MAGVAAGRDIWPQAERRLGRAWGGRRAGGTAGEQSGSGGGSAGPGRAAGRVAAVPVTRPGTLVRVAKVFSAPPGDEAANMAALVVTNAMVFQERLASSNAAIQPTSAARSGDVFSRLRLLTLWDAILEIDYYPIFHMARNVVAELSEVEAAWVLEECAHTASRLLGMGAVGRHDLAGRIFNQLVADRKLLAAFYTSIPAATLLAGLALTPERWPQVGLGRCGASAASPCGRPGLRDRHAADGRLSADRAEPGGRSWFDMLTTNGGGERLNTSERAGKLR